MPEVKSVPLEMATAIFEYSHEARGLMWKYPDPSLFSSDKEYKRFLTRWAGKKAGGPSVGGRGNVTHVTVRINGRSFSEHRVVWEMLKKPLSYGEWIDHVDRDPTNNRIENLRLCDNVTNQHNRDAPSNNTSGFKGVSFSRKMNKWKVATRSKGEYFHRGYFNTRAEAAVAAAKQSLKIHGKFSPYYPAHLA